MSEKSEKEGGTLVIDPAGVVVNTDCPCCKEKEFDAPDRDEENRNNLGRKPPKDGPCKRCGLDRPLNRLMLCYPCWVKTEIENREKSEGREWHEGDSHPEWCKCSGLGEHKTGNGAFTGNN